MWQLTTFSFFGSDLAMIAHPAPSVAPPELDGLMLFGFLSAFLTVVFFIHRDDSRASLMVFAVCLMATAAYGFLQGAWPVGIIQSVWSIATIQRWRLHKRPGGTISAQGRGLPAQQWDHESRISRMFGST